MDAGGVDLHCVEIALAYIIYPICTQIFTIVYTFWGSCLFAVGPFVIALAPSSVVNSIEQVLHTQPRRMECLDGPLRGLWLPDLGNPYERCPDGSQRKCRGARVRSSTWRSPRRRHRGDRAHQHHLRCADSAHSAGGGLRSPGQFSAVGAGLSMAFSRMTNGGIQGARAGASAGRPARPAPLHWAQGLSLMGVGTGALFTNGNGGSFGVPMQGMAASVPPPNTPPPDNFTREFRHSTFHKREGV